MSELDWLCKNLKEIRKQYKGCWIAIKDGKIVAFAPDVKELMSLIPKEVDTPFVTNIPEKEPPYKFVMGYDGRIKRCI